MKPLALILLANGTNRDLDVTQAFELAGARTEIVPLNSLRSSEKSLRDYDLLVLPGGFSYADALGAGKLLALDMQAYFADEVGEFIQQGKPVIGICNGFQALVKSGLLPALAQNSAQPEATLTFNASGHFECRWVTLRPSSQKCIWTQGMSDDMFCPVAHGEGNFLPADSRTVDDMRANDQIALIYSYPNGSPAEGQYPYNPNGSAFDIAGICNPQGNVLGLMPHPENHILLSQHPGRTRNEKHGLGLPLFINGVRYVAGR